MSGPGGRRAYHRLPRCTPGSCPRAIRFRTASGEMPSRRAAVSISTDSRLWSCPCPVCGPVTRQGYGNRPHRRTPLTPAEQGAGIVQDIAPGTRDSSHRITPALSVIDETSTSKLPVVWHDRGNPRWRVFTWRKHPVRFSPVPVSVLSASSRVLLSRRRRDPTLPRARPVAASDAASVHPTPLTLSCHHEHRARDTRCQQWIALWIL